MALAVPGMAQAETACPNLVATKFPHAEVLSARTEMSGTTEICHLTVVSRPTRTSEIGIEVWLPVGAAWSGFVVAGDLCLTQEQRGEEECVVTRELATGHERWRHTDAARYNTTIEIL